MLTQATYNAVMAPAFSPAAGSYIFPVDVTLTTNGVGACCSFTLHPACASSSACSVGTYYAPSSVLSVSGGTIECKSCDVLGRQRNAPDRTKESMSACLGLPSGSRSPRACVCVCVLPLFLLLLSSAGMWA